jgi:RNA-dependent RNA polymerase
MFRNVDLLDPDKPVEGLPAVYPEVSAPLKDPISYTLAPLIQRTLSSDADVDNDERGEDGHAEQVHAHYVREMRYICVTHTLVDQPEVRLKEEVVLGTILANCVQSRWRNDRTYRMRLHTEGLVDDIRARNSRIAQGDETPTDEQLRSGFSRAWEVWAWAQHHRDEEFIQSFSLIVLGIILSILVACRRFELILL